MGHASLVPTCGTAIPAEVSREWWTVLSMPHFAASGVAIVLTVSTKSPLETPLMKIAASVLAAAVTTVSSAEFIEFCYSQIQTSNSGVELDVYTIWARFSGATDTVLNAFNFNRVDGSVANMFYHKDEATFSESAGSSLLTKSVGTWNPGQTGSATANNPFDSYLTIGGLASAANSTNADPSWPVNGGSWNRPDIPNGFNVGWFNSNPLNLQGRVGVGANLGDAVRLGQFVVDRGANGGALEPQDWLQQRCGRCARPVRRGNHFPCELRAGAGRHHASQPRGLRGRSPPLTSACTWRSPTLGIACEDRPITRHFRG